jgi:glycosyltransferase involved in cell wall biosynthesis
LKGGDRLIDSAPGVQAALGVPLDVTFAGDGPARAVWEARARAITSRNRAVRIRFSGWLEQSDLSPVIDTADALVMPSLWPEPFGLIGLEANRRGVPVVAYATGGIPEWLVEGRNGCLAPANPPTVAGLSDAILRCLTRLSSGDALGQRSRAAALERSDEAHVSALLAVLRDAARTRGPSTSTPNLHRPPADVSP